MRKCHVTGGLSSKWTKAGFSSAQLEPIPLLMNFNIPSGKVAKEEKQKSFCGAKYYDRWHLHFRWDNLTWTWSRVHAPSLGNEKWRMKIKANIVLALYLSYHKDKEAFPVFLRQSLSSDSFARHARNFIYKWNADCRILIIFFPAVSTHGSDSQRTNSAKWARESVGGWRGWGGGARRITKQIP